MEPLIFDADLWLWDGEAAWVFLTVPGDVGEEIRMLAGPPRGFGSVRVEVNVGATSWRTSVFPDKEHGFLLPVKKAVRRAEGIDVGDRVEVALTVVDSA
ncbi:DUF1905 domain-containing protein [Nocardioides limicola]|uniref:DUF1905 domain-containing protein n=1 Tax=Nocardioides limicola TaxID=2803368 RepID=UPI00193AEDCA|nr:DUF1905 domain-containing protein [Nocardioides sp. DJM-14]